MNRKLKCIFSLLMASTIALALCSTDKIINARANEGPTAIFKLDDLNPENTDKFAAIAQIAKNENIKVSFGVIGNKFSKATDETFALLRTWYASGIEIWHHGYLHMRSEYSMDDYETQAENFGRTVSLLKDKCGINVSTFGSPYNNANETTLEMINDRFPQIKTVLLASGSAENTAKYLPALCAIESSTGVCDYDTFLSSYQSAKENGYLVMQGHCGQWDDTSVQNFNKIIAFLKSENCSFKTPAEYTLGYLPLLDAKSGDSGALTADISYDYESNALKITGNSTFYDNNIYFRMAKEKCTAMQADDINNNQALLLALSPDENGKFTKDIVLPENFNAGRYTVSVCRGISAVTKSVTLYNKNVIESLTPQITTLISKEQIADMLESNSEALVIDSEILEDGKSELAAIIYAHIPKSGYQTKTFLKVLNGAEAALSIKKGMGTIKDLLYKYSDAGVDATLMEINTEEEKELSKLLAAADYEKNDFDEIYYGNLFLVKLNCAQSVDDVKNAVEKCYAKVGIDLGEYNKLSEYKRDKCCATMKNSQPQSIGDIKQAWNAAVAAQKTQASDGGGGRISSGGGSGTSGRSKNYKYSPFSASENLQSPQYNDILGHWSEKAVKALSEKKLVSGYPDSSYRPDKNVTRAEFAKLLSGLIENNGTGTDFSDVMRNEWYFESVNKCSAAEIIKGYNGKFHPNETVTREDAALMLYRTLVFNGKTTEISVGFSDEDLISDYARSAVEALAGAEIVSGYEDKFMPKDFLTRGAAAVMLYNLSNYIGR